MMFIVPGEPRGKGRPRFMRNGHAYTPKETREYEEKVAACFWQQGGQKIPSTKTVKTKEGKLVEVPQPIKMEVWAFMNPAESAPLWKRALMKIHSILPCKKPDLDNIGKIISDALNGRAYEDDKDICDLYLHKRYSETPRVEVSVEAE